MRYVVGFLTLVVILTSLVIVVEKRKMSHFLGNFNHVATLSDGHTKLLMDNKELIIHTRDCKNIANQRIELSMALGKNDSATVGEIMSQATGLDFDWSDKIRKPDSSGVFHWLAFSGCMASVPLDEFSIYQIDIGFLGSKGEAFEDKIDLTNIRYSKEFEIVNLTDRNWTNGIHKHIAGFFVVNKFENRQSLRLGDVLEFYQSGERTVVKIAYYEEFINVFVSGDILDGQDAGVVRLVDQGVPE